MEWPLTLVSVPKILSNPLVASNHLGNCVRQPNALSFDRDNNRDIPITPIMGCCECNHLITALTSRCHGMSVRIANVRESPHKTIEVLVVIVMLLIALPSALSAQQLPEPKPLRFDLTPFIGYRTSMSFPVEPHVTGMNPRVVLDASPSYGVSLGMRLANEGDLVEMRWARQDSYVHAEDITPQPLRQHMILDQFHGDFSHETPIEDWASWARPFVLASVGATHVSGSRTSASRVSHLESEPGSGSMPVAISASKFKPNGCRFLWIRMWLSFAARVASFMPVARQVLRVRCWWDRYYDSDS